MPLSLGPFKINLNDKLRSGFRVKYNLLVDKVIKDGQAYASGIKLITHDNTEIEIDILEYFYSKEQIDEMFFIDYATEEEAGKIRIATIEEVMEGEDDLTVVTPYKLWLLLNSFSGRAVVAGEDLVAGDFVYLKLPEEDEEEPDPEEEPDLYPVMLAYKALATDPLTCVMGFVEDDALEGEVSAIRFTGNINTYQTELIPGTYYYLSDVYPGVLSAEPPQLPGAYQQIVGYAISDIELMVEIHRPYLNWSLVFTNKFPQLEFEVGKYGEASVLLTDYLQEYNIFEEEENEEDPGEEPRIITGYSYRYLILPDWVSLHNVVFENLAIGGTPDKVGKYKAFLEVSDRDKRLFLQEIVLNVNPPTKVKINLYDTTSGFDLVGPVPGMYELVDEIDLSFQIIGVHDEWEARLVGGGDTGGLLDELRGQEVNQTGDATYRMFELTDGRAVEAGQYTFTLETFRNGNSASITTAIFILYDEEFLAKLKFFLVSGGVDIGEISPDGTSNFSNPGSANVKSIIDDVEHDRAFVELLLEGVSIQTRNFPLGSPVMDGTYLVYSTDQELAPGMYTIKTSLFLTETVGMEEVESMVLYRYTTFEIAEPKKPVTGGLKFVTMLPGKQDYSVISELNPTGNLLALPSNWNILSDAESEEYDYESHWLKQLKGGALPEIDIQKYTQEPQYNTYSYPINESQELLFRFLNSTKIGYIHEDETTFRVNFTRRLGGANGKIVAIFQADFSFGVLEDIEETPEEAENSSVLYKAGEGLSEIFDKGVTTFNVNTDDLTVEVHQPTDPLLNHLRVKLKGITHAHYQDVPTLTLLGKLTAGTGSVYSVPVLNGASAAAASDMTIGTTLWVDNRISGIVTPGTANYYARYNAGGTTIGNGFIYDNNTNRVFINATLQVNPTAWPKILLSGDATNSYIHFADATPTSLSWINGQSDKLVFAVGGVEAFRLTYASQAVRFVNAVTIAATGVAPLIVASNILVTNLNADLLDGFHGPYYLDRTNHTGTQLANTISNFSTAVLGTVLTGLAIVTGSPITSADTILSAFGKLQGQVNTNTSSVSGTASYYSRFKTGGASIGDGFIYDNGTNRVFVNATMQVNPTSFHKLILSGDASNTFLHFADATPTSLAWINGQSDKLVFAVGGTEVFRMTYASQDARFVKAINIATTTTAPLVVASTILVTNFNADLLDGQHGPYYLDRANHTGTQLASTISNFSTAVLATTLTGLSTTNSTITSSDTVISAFGKLQGQITGKISGTANYYARFAAGGTSIGNGFIHDNDSNRVYIDATLQVNPSAWPKFLLSGDATNTYIHFADATPTSLSWINGQATKLSFAVGGTEVFRMNYSTQDVTFQKAITIGGSSAPLVVSSSSLVINFNADLLDGQHGAYYLDWNNLTNKTTGVAAGTYRSVTVDIYGRVTAGTNPNTLAGYGLDTTVYTKAQVDALIGGAGTLGGSGTTGYIAKFTAATTLGNSPILDTGSEINIANTRSFGVEGPAAMRDYLHVWGYCNMGTASNPGTLLLHQANSGTIHASAAFEIRSTSKGLLYPRMTTAQRQAISSPAVGLAVWVTDTAVTGGYGPGIFTHIGAGLWSHSTADYIGA